MNIQDKFRDPSPVGQKPSAAKPAGPAQPSPTLAPKKPPVRARRRPMLVAGIAALLLLGAGYYFWNRSADTAGTPVLATAVRGDVEDVVTAVGSLTPLTSVDVGAQVTGQLETLHVMIGDDVKKGDLLAEIDAKVTSAKVDADNAQLQNFQAQLVQRQSDQALAQLQADRQARLMRDMATSQDLLDTAQATFTSAQAQVKSVAAQIAQAQSTLKADQATLGYSKIFAPMPGTVTAMPAKEGQTLNANQTAPLILTIADLSTMTVSTQVSEADVPKLRVGMDAYFTTLGDPGRRWMGKLRQILPTPTVVNNVVLYTALFDVANPNKTLMPQMTAQVFFVRGAARNAVLIPVAALQYGNRNGARAARDGSAQVAPAREETAVAGAGRQGGRRGGGAGRGAGVSPGNAPPRQRPATVTVVKDDGTQEIRNVVVGVTDRVNAEIVSGLAEGEKVVAGTNQAAPGARQGGRALGQPGRAAGGRF